MNSGQRAIMRTFVFSFKGMRQGIYQKKTVRSTGAGRGRVRSSSGLPAGARRTFYLLRAGAARFAAGTRETFVGTDGDHAEKGSA